MDKIFRIAYEALAYITLFSSVYAIVQYDVQHATYFIGIAIWCKLCSADHKKAGK